jgi:hypothetical protein
MAIIKSNSALIGFDHKFQNYNYYSFLDYVQSFNISTSTKRTNNKFLSKDNLIRKQFVKPEVVLDLTYFQTNNFLNERLFGFLKILNINTQLSVASKIIEDPLFTVGTTTVPFKNDYAYILLSELNEDLLETFLRLFLKGYDVAEMTNKIISISLGNLFINSYSFSYSLNQLPVVSCSFLCSDLKISNLKNQVNTGLYVDNWNNTRKYLSSSEFEEFSERSKDSKEYLVLLMKDLIFENNFSETSTPGPNIDNFLNGLIQKLDISIDSDKRVNYFIN